MTLEERIQAIEDREAIRELTAEYCHAIAAADVPAILGLFCEDASFTMNGSTTRGRTALEAFYQRATEQPPIPFVQNHVVDEIRGDEARARCSAELRMVQGDQSITAAGWYDDSFRRVDGRWLFHARDLHVFHMVPLSDGWA